MNRPLKQAAIVLIVLGALLGVHASQAQTIQSASLTPIGPAGCPTSGCAAGQTLDYRASFDLGAFEPAQLPNVQVCFYTPTAWNTSDWRIDATGGISGAPYQADTTNCSPAPTDYGIASGASAQLSSAFGDVLNIGFRIGRTAPANPNGSLVIRVFQHNGTAWTQTDQTFVSIPVIAAAASVYAANDSAACGNFSPCYLNSGSDRDGGKGTGLKDGVDAQPTTITVLGNYQVKSQTVLIDQPVILQGLDDSRITYVGSTCTNAVLKLTSAVTVRNLTITDGTCTTTNRDLVAVDSAQDVSLEFVDLLNGLDALKIADNAGNVTIRFSQALNNSGYAVLRVPKVSGGTLLATGSNLYGNRAGAQVDCGQAGAADHNFWGFGVTAGSATANCAAVDTKQLGAPVLPRDSAAGVSGEKVTVTTIRQNSFGGLIGYQRAGDGADYELNIVNHGAGSPENVPFTGGSSSSLVACSNYYDVFLEKTAAAGGTLNLTLRYDRTSGCTSTIETSAYCTGSDQTRFPLYWYSPSSSAPTGWNTTGATGQTTTCDTAANEISAVIDASGRPDFATDLNFTPFVVGLPSQPSSVVITKLGAIPGNAQVTVQWTTASEVNTAGFYVLRSTVEAGGFERVSPFIARKGSSSSGASYEYLDTGLTNNTTYYYRLEIISTSMDSSFSQVVSAVPGQATSTTTLTATASATATATTTSTGTVTLTKTITRTPTVTKIPTRTRTQIRYATYFTGVTPTRGPTRTLFPSRTPTRTATGAQPTETPTEKQLVTILSGETTTVTATDTPLGEGTLPPGAGYPVTTPSPNATEISQVSAQPSASSAAVLSPTPGSPGSPTKKSTADQILELNRRYRPWLLGLLGFELVVLLIAGLWLYKHHMLTFHPDQHEGEPPEETE